MKTLNNIILALCLLELLTLGYCFYLLDFPKPKKEIIFFCPEQIIDSYMITHISSFKGKVVIQALNKKETDGIQPEFTPKGWDSLGIDFKTVFYLKKK